MNSTVNTNAIQQATSRTKSAAGVGKVAGAAVPTNPKPNATMHPFGEKSSGTAEENVCKQNYRPATGASDGVPHAKTPATYAGDRVPTPSPFHLSSLITHHSTPPASAEFGGEVESRGVGGAPARVGEVVEVVDPRHPRQ